IPGGGETRGVRDPRRRRAAGGRAPPPVRGPARAGGGGRPDGAVPPLLFGLPAGSADPRAGGGLPPAPGRPDPGRLGGGQARARRAAVDLPRAGPFHLTPNAGQARTRHKEYAGRIALPPADLSQVTATMSPVTLPTATAVAACRARNYVVLSDGGTGSDPAVHLNRHVPHDPPRCPRGRNGGRPTPPPPPT